MSSTVCGVAVGIVQITAGCENGVTMTALLPPAPPPSGAGSRLVVASQAAAQSAAAWAGGGLVDPSCSRMADKQATLVRS